MPKNPEDSDFLFQGYIYGVHTHKKNLYFLQSRPGPGQRVFLSSLHGHRERGFIPGRLEGEGGLGSPNSWERWQSWSCCAEPHPSASLDAVEAVPHSHGEDSAFSKCLH